MRSCLIDGEVVCCDERGLARFDVLRRRRNEAMAFLYAFDLLELDGADLRREPIEVRKTTLASVLRKSRPGLRLNEHFEHPEGTASCSSTPARSAAKGSLASGSARVTAPAGRPTGSSSRTQRLRRCGGRPRRTGGGDERNGR